MRPERLCLGFTGPSPIGGRPRIGPEGLKRVVGDEALPHEAPKGIDCFTRVPAAGSFMHHTKKRGALPAKRVEDCRLSSVEILWGWRLGGHQCHGPFLALSPIPGRQMWRQ